MGCEVQGECGIDRKLVCTHAQHTHKTCLSAKRVLSKTFSFSMEAPAYPKRPSVVRARNPNVEPTPIEVPLRAMVLATARNHASMRMNFSM